MTLFWLPGFDSSPSKFTDFRGGTGNSDSGPSGKAGAGAAENVKAPRNDETKQTHPLGYLQGEGRAGPVQRATRHSGTGPSYDLHPSQIIDGKPQLVEHAIDGFGGGKAAAEPSVDVKVLYAKIGQLTLENDFFGRRAQQSGRDCWAQGDD